jgi:hypothetical protein
MDDLRRVQHLRLHEAAAAFEMGATQFKRICRDVGLTRWPQRKVRIAIDAKVMLKPASSHDMYCTVAEP